MPRLHMCITVLHVGATDSGNEMPKLAANGQGNYDLVSQQRLLTSGSNRSASELAAFNT